MNEPGGPGPPIDGRYEVIQLIGRGGYGSVFKARDLVTGKIVALKCVKIFDCRVGLPVSFFREKKILQSFDHENVVSLQKVVVNPDDDSVYMVLDYCEFDLDALISKGRLSQEHVRSYVKQLFTAVAELHSRGFVHRDLKPSNVFVTLWNVVKLGDFGLATSLENRGDRPLTKGVVTPSYRAPELLLGDGQYDQSVDVWALGCVLFEVLTGTILFRPTTLTSASQLASIFKICGTPQCDHLKNLPGFEMMGRSPEYPYMLDKLLDQVLPDAFRCCKDLLEAMLQLDPSRRITVAQALTHPFFDFDPVALPTLPVAEIHSMDVIRARVPAKIRPIQAHKAKRIVPPQICMPPGLVPVYGQ
jgi:serine/threonine protein kinase